jgi:hypothetical protein
LTVFALDFSGFPAADPPYLVVTSTFCGFCRDLAKILLRVIPGFVQHLVTSFAIHHEI